MALSGNTPVSGLISAEQTNASKDAFAVLMQGVSSICISIKTFAFGEINTVAGPLISRRFYYNEAGKVRKKLFFGPDGNIVTKEEYEFDSKGRIVSGRYITDDYINYDEYEYDSKGFIKEYRFLDPKWPLPKREVYEVDKSGRVLKKISFGLLGLEELITEYIYDGSSKKYTFRHMTSPEGKLIMTFYYRYTATGKYAGLYGFLLEPEEVKKLVDSNKKTSVWEMRSEFRSVWHYDAKDNMTGFLKDEKVPEYVKLDFGLLNDKHALRLPVQKTSYEYEKISGKDRLVRITEWLPRYDEPMQVVKEYSYYNKNGNQIYPVPNGT